MAFATPRTWQKGDIFCTTDSMLIPVQQLNDLFSRQDFHCAEPLLDTQIQMMLRNSLCFALMHKGGDKREPNRLGDEARLIGLGRWITDGVTVVYTNDIYIAEEHRGRGLAKWLLAYMNEQLELMPALRGTIMIVEKDTPSETLYRRHFGMEDLVASDILLDRKGPGSACVLKI